MNGFGKYNSFPFTFGGGESVHELEHQALLDAMKLALDPAEGTENWCEAYAEAGATSMIWSINRRLSNQMLPMRMLDTLEDWEKVTRTLNYPDEPLVSRRKKVAAKLRGQPGNSPSDIEAMVETLAGDNFVGIVSVDDNENYVFWPGMNPGPPGYEWCSSRATECIVLNTVDLFKSQYLDLVATVKTYLNQYLPTWEDFEVGTSGPFVCGQGIVGRTYL